MPGMRPDIIGHGIDVALLIEVAVTHYCDQAKVDLIRSRTIMAMEIDLAEYLRDLSPEALRAAVLFDAPRKWLWHSEVERLIAEAEQRHLQLIEQRKERDRLAREQAQAEALAAARAVYVKERVTIEREAVRLLGPARATQWATEDRLIKMLLSPSYDVEGRPLHWLKQLERDADRIVRADKRKRVESEEMADLKNRLTVLAAQHFRSRERGDLWLNSTNPKLGRKRPIEFCVDAGSYRECIDALP